MANFQLPSPFQNQIFIQRQYGLRNISNVNGQWDNAGLRQLRVFENTLQMKPNRGMTSVNWLHGSRSPLASIIGRKSGTWSISNLPIIPSGTKGIPPDSDVLLRSAFGANSPTGDFVQYYPDFGGVNPVPFFLLSKNSGSADFNSRYALGCIVEQVTFTLNQNLLQASFNGSSVYVIDSDTFAAEDAIAQGGLASFPSNTGIVANNGQMIPGFGMECYVNETYIETQIYGAEITFNTGLQLKGDYVDDAYPASIIAGGRLVTGKFTLADNNGVALKQLKQIAKSFSANNYRFVLGKTPGYVVAFYLNNVQLGVPDYSDQSGFIECSFGDAAAHAGAPGKTDDFLLTFA